MSHFLPISACEPIHFLLTVGVKKKVKTCRHNPATRCNAVSRQCFPNQLQARPTSETCRVWCLFPCPQWIDVWGSAVHRLHHPMTSYPQQWKPDLRNALRLCFPFSSFFPPPPDTFSLNVGYMQLTHKRQKWSSLNPMLQSINSPTSASFQLMLQPLSHKRSPHPQFYYNLTKIRQPLAKPQWKASWESALGTQEGWKCLSCGLVTTLLGWRPSWQRHWLVTDRAGSG